MLKQVSPGLQLTAALPFTPAHVSANPMQVQVSATVALRGQFTNSTQCNVRRRMQIDKTNSGQHLYQIDDRLFLQGNYPEFIALQHKTQGHTLVKHWLINITGKNEHHGNKKQTLRGKRGVSMTTQARSSRSVVSG